MNYRSSLGRIQNEDFGRVTRWKMFTFVIIIGLFTSAPPAILNPHGRPPSIVIFWINVVNFTFFQIHQLWIEIVKSMTSRWPQLTLLCLTSPSLLLRVGLAVDCSGSDGAPKTSCCANLNIFLFQIKIPQKTWKIRKVKTRSIFWFKQSQNL